MKRATLVLASLILTLGSAEPARGGSVTLTLSSAGNSLPIDLNSPFANPGSTPDSLVVNTAALNAFLGGGGSVVPFLGGSISFSSLGATSNFPGTPGGATLTVSGTANLTGGDGPASVKVVVTESGFTVPSGPGTLHNTASANFDNASTDSNQSSSSTLDATSTPLLTLTSSGLAPNSQSGSNSTGATGSPAGYTLSETITITLAGAGASDQFRAEADFTASPTVAAPEPASLTLLGLGSLGLVGYGRSRRKA